MHIFYVKEKQVYVREFLDLFSLLATSYSMFPHCFIQAQRKDLSNINLSNFFFHRLTQNRIKMGNKNGSHETIIESRFSRSDSNAECLCAVGKSNIKLKPNYFNLPYLYRTIFLLATSNFIHTNKLKIGFILSMGSGINGLQWASMMIVKPSGFYS